MLPADLVHGNKTHGEHISYKIGPEFKKLQEHFNAEIAEPAEKNQESSLRSRCSRR